MKKGLSLLAVLLLTVFGIGFLIFNAYQKVSAEEVVLGVCGDGLDNDGDGLVDASDFGCHTDWDVNNTISYDPLGNSEKEIQKVSVAWDSAESDGDSCHSFVSADGHYVTFASSATNLVPIYSSYFIDNGVVDIFIYDRFTKEMKKASVSSGRTGGDGSSYEPSVSADGRYVVFKSYASNLVSEDNNDNADIFIHDFQTDDTKRISVAPDGAEADDRSEYASISSDGKYVKFYSYATNLIVGGTDPGVGLRVYIYNVETGTISLASTDIEDMQKEMLSFSAFSADKRFTVFSSPLNSFVPGDTNEVADIFVYDNLDGATERVSVATDGTQAEKASNSPSISADGRYVFFESMSDNLVSGDNNGKEDLFVYDRQTKTIARVSQDISALFNPGIISASGEYITFATDSGDLVPNDSNGKYDVFIVRNPLFEGSLFELPIESILKIPTDLKQQNGSDGAEVEVGKIINEGLESADSVILSARVANEKGGEVSLEVQIEKVNPMGMESGGKSVMSEPVNSGEIASISYTPEQGGLYLWKARTVNEFGDKSDWAEFGGNSTIETDFISSNFSFVHLTDVHLGSNTAIVATAASKDWYETWSYPRFTDVLYDIEQLSPRPDFILMSGDCVEYNNARWLWDFKYIIEDFSKRTGIEIYLVPGNHDRYDSESSGFSLGDVNFSGGNDYLEKFLSVLDLPENVTSFFADTEIMHLATSGAQGFNKFNYSFDYEGVQFIGLDSGEDTGIGDPDPEGSGLSGDVLNELESLITETPDTSRVIFMHHPVFADQEEPLFYNKLFYKEQERTDTGEIAEDGAIVNNWKRFIGDCNSDSNNVQLILSGHTHKSLVSDSPDHDFELSDWVSDKTYPLYIQTQSTSKGDDSGYRVVEIKNGKAIPRESKTDITRYEKIYSDLEAGTGMDLRTYDVSNGQEITNEKNQDSTSFFAPATDKIIIYKTTEESQFEVKNSNLSEKNYDLQLQKREEGIDNRYNMAPVFGYKIMNSVLCGGSGYCSLVTIQEGNGYTDLNFKNIKVNSNSSNTVFVNWDEINKSNFSSEIDGLSFGAGDNYVTNYSYLPISVTIDLNSPGELRAYDKNGNVTGLVDGEIVENIPDSMYVPETETVYIFGNTKQEIVEGLKNQVVGSYEATYDFSATLSENGEEKDKFIANDVLINGDTTHQFSVDWEVLAHGGKGVKMEFDENKDGKFEKSVSLGKNLSAPEAKLSSEKYVTDEGTKIKFNAKASSDPDGKITLYEWDFEGDGIYDAKSSSPTMTHLYADDFQGKVFLRVTGQKGLTNVTSAEVAVTNVKPTVTILKFEKAEKEGGYMWYGGRLRLWASEATNKYILEGKFTDSGWLDTHKVSIDWGDGSVENIPVSEKNRSPRATGKISATHEYNQMKKYVVKLTVTDDDGGADTQEIYLKSVDTYSGFGAHSILNRWWK
ncbi:MAG: PKD domain-containing protein [Candidatus Pacebacteria bacterium]|nr:PKD domain-containing protein [Candidatus Paceibacterota bacterium]